MAKKKVQSTAPVIAVLGVQGKYGATPLLLNDTHAAPAGWGAPHSRRWVISRNGVVWAKVRISKEVIHLIPAPEADTVYTVVLVQYFCRTPGFPSVKNTVEATFTIPAWKAPGKAKKAGVPQGTASQLGRVLKKAKAK